MDLRNKVLTVLGPISPEVLGIVLPHEHLLLDFKAAHRCTEYGNEDLTDLPFAIENMGKIRQYPYSHGKNLEITSEDEIVHELKLYKAAGGGSVCDLTVTGIRIKPELLPKISSASNVHIICGTGYYVDSFIPDDIKTMEVSSIAENMITDIQIGVSNSNAVRCGVIGEIGCSWPLTAYEKKVLQAAAIAQTKTGAPLIIHPGRADAAPFEIVDILLHSGADLSRTIMSHIDRTIQSKESLLKFAQLGCGIEYDLFGIESSHYQFNADIDMPSDAQRIQMVRLLVESGYKERLFLSQDIHTKHRLVHYFIDIKLNEIWVKYGGHGYGHLLNNVVPKMIDRGILKDIVNQMMIDNPKKWLTFV